MWYRYAKARGLDESKRKRLLSLVPDIVGTVKSVIDFGCSTGLLLDLFPEDVDKICIEIDEEAKKVVEEKGYKVYSDLRKAPMVECITMVDVLEHLEPEYFVNELLPLIRSKLISNGKLYIQTYNPFNPYSLVDFYNDYTHKFMWTLSSLIAVLRMYNFRIVRAGYIHPIQASSLLGRTMLKIASKILRPQYLYIEEYVLAIKKD